MSNYKEGPEERRKEISDLLSKYCLQNPIDWLAEQGIVKSCPVIFYQIYNNSGEFVGDSWDSDISKIVRALADEINIDQLKEKLEESSR